MAHFPNTDLLGMQKRSYAEIDFSEKKPVVSEEVVRLSKKEKRWVWGIGGMIVLLSLVLGVSGKLNPMPVPTTSFVHLSGDSLTLYSKASLFYYAPICCLPCWESYKERQEILSLPSLTRIDPDLIPPFKRSVLVGYSPPNWDVLRGIPEIR